ncbi:MAG: aminotransferase class I/II-fold pyridoxal phosphate-dependent enzyme [Thermomicrobiales bacterium]|nr:aminotransferase class I/II-fold pyridoxal phosphate-dependent enzyme [Thermomicrobiales bacterium]
MKLETFALERWMTTWETVVSFDIAESGIYPLSTAELFGLLPEDQAAAAQEELLNIRLGYTEARGTERLRGTLAETYEQVSPDDILVATGAIEANFLLFTSLLEAGDHVVAVYPAYQQLHSVARAIGCEVTPWTISQCDNHFAFDIDALERLVRKDTRLIVVNTPHNPTGAILSQVDLERIYGIAEEANAYVLCDEAYRWLDMPGGEPLAPPMRNLGPRAISVGTVSKPFGLPGLRIGWIAATEEIASACWSTRDYTSLSPAGLSDYLATVALRNRDALIARNHEIVRNNLETADVWFAEHGDLAAWDRPRGGLLALVRYAAANPSSEVADLLAKDYSVMLAPGSAFGYESHLRIGVGQRPDIFAEGLRRAAICLRSLSAEGN